MVRYIVLALLGLFLGGATSAQPRIQLPEETRVVSEHYKNANRDFVILSASFWQNDPKYDRKTEEYLAFVRQELGRRGFTKTNEELPPFGDEFFNGMRRHQHRADIRPYLCRIELEHWSGPQSQRSRETYANADCQSGGRSDNDGFPRSKASSDYIQKLMERFDEGLTAARAFQAEVNARLKR